jgi:hypothetical protein
VEWVALPGQAIDKLEIEVFRVTFPGGVRTETHAALYVRSAHPVIPLDSSDVYKTALVLPGIYVVHARLTVAGAGVVSFVIPIVSQDFAL